MTEWIDVTTKCPKEFKDYLVTDKKKVWITKFKWPNPYGHNQQLGFGIIFESMSKPPRYVTHWAELPEPPSEYS